VEFVLDTNVIASILIKPRGTIYEIFLKIKDEHSLFISDITLLELKEHQSKLLRLSKLNISEFELLKGQVLRFCSIVASEFISEKTLIEAYRIVEKYDKKDIAFVATTIHLNALLWSTDQKLLKGLRGDGFMQIISTKELVATLGGF
jgi:predicted nucleic acid-binding protein